MLKALVTAEVVKETLEVFKEIEFKYAGYNIDHEVMDREELKREIADIDILICEYDTIDEEILKCANKLKLIICCRGGYKSVIDVELTKKMKIMVCNTAGRNADAVADLVMSFILDMTRNVISTNNLIHAKVITQDFSTKPKEYKDTVWGLNDDSPFIKYRGRSIKYMTLGIVGFGFVGKILSKKAKAFDMNIVVYDPYEEKKGTANVDFVDFDTLLKVSDIITLHCPKTSETVNMFNRDTLLKIKKGGYFINTSRGGLVDEDALVELLNSGHLAGAALDVTNVEPISSDSPLVTAQNLILTPHIGGSADDVQIQGTDIIIKTLTAWLNNDIPYNAVY